MELNWSTFVLEIINFIILVWILKRFLYKPVLNIVARRKAEIEQTLNEATHLHNDADTLRNQYENRLHEWDQEKQHARDKLKGEIEKERAKLLQELQDSIDKERERRHVREQQQIQTAVEKAEETALTLGAQFASKLLKSVTGPEIEARLIELLITELGNLSQDSLKKLRADWGENNYEVSIVTAYPLNDSQCQQIQKALKLITQRTLSFLYKQDSDLVAGIFISIGAWTLSANLRDELKGFVEIRRES